MTVYSNIITINGEDAAHAVFRAVQGWLKTQLGYHLDYREIFRTDILEGAKTSGIGVRCKTYLATKGEPKLYAWRLWHRDSAIPTREWVVQIGVRETAEQVTASVVVSIEDDNTLINAMVQPSRPRFVQYLMEAVETDKELHLSESTPSSDPVWLTDEEHQVLAFREEIHRPSRTYPIVLVAPESNGHPLISTSQLSMELVGLAQIVLIEPNCDTFVLAEILNQRYSAYHGAINVIAPPSYVDQVVRTRLLLGEELEQIDPQAREQFVLANVTAFTNRLYRRDLITRDSVLREANRQNTALRMRGFRERLAEQSEHADGEVTHELEALLDAADEERTELEQLLQEEKQQRHNQDYYILELEERVKESDDKIRTLQYQLNAQTNAGGEEDTQNKGRGMEALTEDLAEILLGPDHPDPDECLTIVEQLFPSRVAILPSARKSAAQSRGFRHSRRLLNLLYRLATGYLDDYLEEGDAAARQIFGNSYAAQESATTIANRDYQKSRTFEYNGTPTVMKQHLKIGVSDNTMETIRVHFIIDTDQRRAVIGYCGPHLPISGR